MNAVIKEALVLTNEAIEVHLHYLRTGLDAVQKALPVLRDKIDQLSASVDAKIEKTNDRIDALDRSLSEKISKVSDDVAELRGYVKTVSWLLSLVSVVAAALSIARTFDWL